jgi:hypothetical protein
MRDCRTLLAFAHCYRGPVGFRAWAVPALTTDMALFIAHERHPPTDPHNYWSEASVGGRADARIQGWRYFVHDQQCLTVVELARLLDCRPSWIYELLHQGRMPGALKDQGKWLIPVYAAQLASTLRPGPRPRDSAKTKNAPIADTEGQGYADRSTLRTNDRH